MPRIIGIFDSTAALADVVDQLTLNGVTATTALGTAQPEHGVAETQPGTVASLDQLKLPQGQRDEYHRRLERGQALLMVEVSAIELPMVQRALRNGAAVDIDLLPDGSA